MKLSKKTEDSIGIDIGSRFIKVISINRKSDNSVLTAYNIKKIPYNTKSNQKIQFVKEVLDEIDLHPNRANLSVSGPDVIARFIEFPKPPFFPCIRYCCIWDSLYQ